MKNDEITGCAGAKTMQRKKRILSQEEGIKRESFKEIFNYEIKNIIAAASITKAQNYVSVHTGPIKPASKFQER
ncbi:hypothetical protein FTO70_13870 [Methanosarcina sp. KYL-1]|uniref:hypothetical protein n=1 Tax=Methanosarcina sp. KYL-1 TaxID=2602068 RepID=UPI0021006D1B|nr:hypothetical protein [Methanosarcina sp. KYL-1]MCQ1536737.1 hypothetical protein [Methanosarcina sp. KYL-1]